MNAVSVMKYQEREEQRNRSGVLRTMNMFPLIGKGVASVTIPRYTLRKRVSTGNTKHGIPSAMFESCSSQLTSMNAVRKEMISNHQHFKPLKETPVLLSVLSRLQLAVEKKLHSVHTPLNLRGFQGKPMTPEDFRSLLLSQVGIRLTRTEVHSIFSHFDSNNDGFVDFQEVFNQFYYPKRMQDRKNRQISNDHIFEVVMDKIKTRIEEKGVNLEDIFADFDSNKDGHVSIEEFIDIIIEKLHCELHEWEIREVFSCFDPNNDGKLRLDEFMFGYYNRRKFLQLLVKAKPSQKSQFVFIPCNPHEAKELISKRY